MENEGLRLGMFLAGLLMASVPVSLAIGIGIYALRRHLRQDGSPGLPPGEDRG